MSDPNPATRLAELEKDNRRLRHLLSQAKASSELRHGLSFTLAMLRTAIRKSAQTSRDIDIYVAHVEDRLNAIMRAQATIDAFGEIELGTLFANELLQHGAPEGKRSQLSGPLILLQPRAGQIMTLAAHELAMNALEHGVLTSKAGRIDVTWTIGRVARNAVEILWKETGPERCAMPTREGFGAEVLKRMLHEEFGAATSLDYEPDGLLWIIRFDLTERIGRHDPEYTEQGSDSMLVANAAR